MGRTLSSRLVVSLAYKGRANARQIIGDMRRLDALSGHTGRAGKAINRQGQRIGRASARAGTAATGAAAIGGLFLKRAYDFDKSLKFVEGSANTTTSKIAALRAKIVELAEKYPKTRSQIVEGAREFITAGNAIDVTTASLQDLVRGALASQQAVGKVGADVTDVVAGFWGKVKDPAEYAKRVRKVLDLMAVGATSANHTWQEQTLAMQYSVPVARALGLSLEQLTASIGVLADNGFKGEKGGSALRTILLNLAAPTKRARAAFKSLGLEMDKAMSFNADKAFSVDSALAQLNQRFGVQGKDVTKSISDVLNNTSLRGDLPKMRDELIQALTRVMDIDPGDLPSMDALTAAVDAHFGSAMENLNLDYVFQKLAKASAGQLKDITGVRRAPQLISLAKGFADQYLPKLKKLASEALGATGKRMAVFLDGFAADIDRLGSALDSLAATIEESGVLRDISRFATSLRSGMISLKQTNPEVLRFGMNALLALGVLGPLGIMLSGLGAVLTIVGASARIVGTAMLFMGRMATTGIASLLVSGVAMAWTGVATAVAAATRQIALFNVLSVAMGGRGAAMKVALAGLAASSLSMLNPLKLAGAAIRGVGVAIRFAFISTGVGAVLAAIAMAGTWIYNNWSGIKAMFSGIGEGFMAALGPARPAAEGIASALGSIFDALGGMVGPLDASEEQWRAWGEAVGGFIATPIRKIIELVDWLSSPSLNNQLTRFLGIYDEAPIDEKKSTNKKPLSLKKSSVVSKTNSSALNSSIPSVGGLPGKSAAARSTAPIDPAALQSELNRLSSSSQAVVNSVRTAMGQAKQVVAAVDLTSQGQRIMQSLAAGLRSQAGAVVEEIRKVTQQVRDHLPSSPAKTGPLSDIHRLKFGETIAQSIDGRPMVAAMHKATSDTMRAANPTIPGTYSGRIINSGAGGNYSTHGGGVSKQSPSIGDVKVTVHIGNSMTEPKRIGDEVGRRVRNAIRETYSDGGI